MSVGTNENVKNVNENSQRFENDIITGSATAEPVNDLEKTQRIVILDELLRDTENSKKEFLEDYSGQKSKNGNKENDKILNSENLEQFTQQQPILEEIKSQNTQNDILQENLNNNSQENVINEIIGTQETSQSTEQTTKIPVQAVVENTTNIQEQTTENIIENQGINQKDSDTIKEETLEEKQKRHTQDKKDYRLERMLFDRINAMQGKIKESLE